MEEASSNNVNKLLECWRTLLFHQQLEIWADTTQHNPSLLHTMLVSARVVIRAYFQNSRQLVQIYAKLNHSTKLNFFFFSYWYKSGLNSYTKNTTWFFHWKEGGSFFVWEFKPLLKLVFFKTRRNFNLLSGYILRKYGHLSGLIWWYCLLIDIMYLSDGGKTFNSFLSLSSYILLSSKKCPFSA